MRKWASTVLFSEVELDKAGELVEPFEIDKDDADIDLIDDVDDDVDGGVEVDNSKAGVEDE